MRPNISKRNLRYLIRQEYGFSNTEQFFTLTQDHPSLRQEVISKTIVSFTGYSFLNNKLATRNPYTSKYESLNIESFDHIQSQEDLLKELSMLHTTRMQMLSQSRKRILELSKQATSTRDRDLNATYIATKQQKRTAELASVVDNRSDKERSQER